MPRVLTCRRLIGIALSACLAAIAIMAVAQTPRAHFVLMNVGGGSGGTSGSAIWSAAWWYGSPQGPGPYTGGTSGGVSICIWHDLGPTLADLDSGLSEASLPLSFWQAKDSGGHPGIWGVDQWGLSALRGAANTDHFDLVACPQASQVPVGAPDVEANVPEATPPKSRPLYIWIFWDTVPDPGSPGSSGLIQQAFAANKLPAPAIETSPSDVNRTADSTVVNIPTWLWISQSPVATWRMYSATASAGGLTAMVWAVPQDVRWQAEWDFSSPGQDREGGTTFGPEILNQVCDGPGTPYILTGPANQTTDCSFEFTQSTFGNVVTLSASVAWDVYWALYDSAGVVGGEGRFAAIVTTGHRPLQVLQVESVISSG